MSWSRSIRLAKKHESSLFQQPEIVHRMRRRIACIEISLASVEPYYAGAEVVQRYLKDHQIRMDIPCIPKRQIYECSLKKQEK